MKLYYKSLTLAHGKDQNTQCVPVEENVTTKSKHDEEGSYDREDSQNILDIEKGSEMEHDEEEASMLHTS